MRNLSFLNGRTSAKNDTTIIKELQLMAFQKVKYVRQHNDFQTQNNNNTNNKNKPYRGGGVKPAVRGFIQPNVSVSKTQTPSFRQVRTPSQPP
jgi:hypothetical protein